jgi:hypothetical protein
VPTFSFLLWLSMNSMSVARAALEALEGNPDDSQAAANTAKVPRASFGDSRSMNNRFDFPTAKSEQPLTTTK